MRDRRRETMNTAKLEAIIAEFESARADKASALRKLDELGLSNASKRGRTMYAYETHKQGRYQATEDEIRAGTGRTVTVSFTVGEQDALNQYDASVAVSNAMYSRYETARNLLAAINGKKMKFRYNGKSSFTGAEFTAGTEIFYVRSLQGTFTIPVSEIDALIEAA